MLLSREDFKYILKPQDLRGPCSRERDKSNFREIYRVFFSLPELKRSRKKKKGGGGEKIRNKVRAEGETTSTGHTKKGES